MPLIKSAKKSAIGKNIKEEEKTHPKKQAVAIALNVARKAGAKIPKPKKKTWSRKHFVKYTQGMVYATGVLPLTLSKMWIRFLMTHVIKLAKIPI